MSRFSSIEPVGILNACTTNVRMKKREDDGDDDRLEVLAQRRFLEGCFSHQSSVSVPIFRTARNASCGISTLPTRFMRFLPSFCFSSSLRLREMSPP